MSSSVCRFAMITLRMLTGFHGDVAVGHARCPNESRTGYRLTFC